MIKGASQGVKLAFKDSEDVLIYAKTGVARRTGGWNFVKNVGPQLLGGYISDEIQHYLFTSGGEIEVQDNPYLSWIPFAGGIFFSNIASTGEYIDDAGNWYDSKGNFICNLQTCEDINAGGGGGAK